MIHNDGLLLNFGMTMLWAGNSLFLLLIFADWLIKKTCPDWLEGVSYKFMIGAYCSSLFTCLSFLNVTAGRMFNVISLVSVISYLNIVCL